MDESKLEEDVDFKSNSIKSCQLLNFNIKFRRRVNKENQMKEQKDEVFSKLRAKMAKETSALEEAKLKKQKELVEKKRFEENKRKEKEKIDTIESKCYRHCLSLQPI